VISSLFMKSGNETAPTHREAPAPDTIVSIGSTGRLVTSGEEAIAVCITVSSFDEFMKLAVANDNEGTTRMVLAGLVFLVPQRTQVRVIDKGGFMSDRTRVRILSGSMAGQDGWVPSEFVVK
jgi:hypothetical protein